MTLDFGIFNKKKKKGSYALDISNVSLKILFICMLGVSVKEHFITNPNEIGKELRKLQLFS